MNHNLWLLVVVGSLTAPTFAQRPTHNDRTAYFGTLHAHSSLSGDVSGGASLEPNAAFAYARTHGLDFLGISDHHKPTGAPGGSKFHMAANTYKKNGPASRGHST